MSSHISTEISFVINYSAILLNITAGGRRRWVVWRPATWQPHNAVHRLTSVSTFPWCHINNPSRKGIKWIHQRAWKKETKQAFSMRRKMSFTWVKRIQWSRQVWRGAILVLRAVAPQLLMCLKATLQYLHSYVTNFVNREHQLAPISSFCRFIVGNKKAG